MKENIFTQSEPRRLVSIQAFQRNIMEQDYWNRTQDLQLVSPKEQDNTGHLFTR